MCVVHTALPTANSATACYHSLHYLKFFQQTRVRKNLQFEMPDILTTHCDHHQWQVQNYWRQCNDLHILWKTKECIKMPMVGSDGKGEEQVIY